MQQAWRPDDAALPHSLIGRIVADKYRVTRLLGHGGMGCVYRAENMMIGRAVALKVLHRHLKDDTVVLARFQREARAAAASGHPNVVDILDMGVDPVGPFIVMEYVHGTSLADLIRSEGPLALERALRIARQIVDALGAVHRAGVVHRDLKPENVLLTTRASHSDVVKIFDFGISTFVDAAFDGGVSDELTPTDRTMATPYYASPEQILGARGRDARVDLYAVGVILYEMLTSHRPFEAPGLAQLCRQIVEDAPTPLRAFRIDVSAGLEAVLHRALAKDPQARFADAAEMLQALQPFGSERPPSEETAPHPNDVLDSDLRALTARQSVLRLSGSLADEPNSSEVAIEMVRGEILLATMAFLRERMDARVLDEVLAYSPPGVRLLVDSEIEPSGWYPSVLFDIVETADRIVGRGDHRLFVDAGRHFARQTFGQSDRTLLVRTITPELLFAMAADIYRRYFRIGTARVVSVTRGHGRLEIRDDPSPRLGRALSIVGYVDEALRLAGARGVDVRLTHAAALGDDADVLEATWS